MFTYDMFQPEVGQTLEVDNEFEICIALTGTKERMCDTKPSNNNYKD